MKYILGLVMVMGALCTQTTKAQNGVITFRIQFEELSFVNQSTNSEILDIEAIKDNKVDLLLTCSLKSTVNLPQKTNIRAVAGHERYLNSLARLENLRIGDLMEGDPLDLKIAAQNLAKCEGIRQLLLTMVDRPNREDKQSQWTLAMAQHHYFQTHLFSPEEMKGKMQGANDWTSPIIESQPLLRMGRQGQAYKGKNTVPAVQLQVAFNVQVIH